MRYLARILFGVAVLALASSAASAAVKYPPGPPYRSCPDSVTIYQVQRDSTAGNACQPAWNDTVMGVRGIITGFRLRSTGRIYLENSNAADYNGLQIYTNQHLESQGFAIGDSISVCGVNGSYQGESQLLGTMATTLFVRKINSGNPLPPFRVGTTSDYKWTPASANVAADKVEGMLVRVEGPLRVARIGPGAGLAANTAWLCVNADGSAPGDSICVDGYQLTSSNIISPALNTTIDWVQGIMRRATPSGTDCWLISLRFSSDLQAQSPPNLSDAYPVADNKVRLVFDKRVDPTSAKNTANYKLGSKLSGSTVDNAVLVGDSSMVDLTITDVLPRLSTESIQTENIGSRTCPACLSPQQSMSFILGVLTCAEVQAPDPAFLGGSPCEDRSRIAGAGSAMGARFTMRGVFVHKYPVGRLFYFEDPGGGPRSGVAVYNTPANPVVGNRYLVVGRIQEFYTMTELVDPVAMIDDGMSAVPAPALQTVTVLSDLSCDAGQSITNGEDYEGVLVSVENVKVVSRISGTSFQVAGPAPSYPDTILVSNYDLLYTLDPDTGMVLNITGELFTNEYGARIAPRGDADITLLSGSPPDYPVLVRPADDATGVQRKPTLTAAVSDPDADNLTVKFYGRKVVTPPTGPECTIVLLPDTQFYTAQTTGTNAIFKAQTEWIANNRASRNIVAVGHLGDVTDSDITIEWMRADTAMTKLEDPVATGLADGIPYVVGFGNHDDNSGGTLYNTYFPASRYSSRGYYGGNYGSSMRNSYILFSGAGRDFIMVNLAYDPSPAVLTWAHGVIAANPSRLAIVVSHSILDVGDPAPWTAEGTNIYNGLKDLPNLLLMACGHMHGEARRTDIYSGNSLTSLLSDYQGWASGGNGYLRIMQIAPAGNQVRVRTYSPWVNTWQTDADSSSQFTLNGMPLGGVSVPDFGLLGTSTGVPSGSNATYQWNGLDATAPYEWYVNVSDNYVGRTGETWSFTTGTATDVTGLPNVLALAPPAHNPARGALRFSFDLPRAMRARLDILDVAGRVVAVLADGDFGAGSYERVWDSSTASHRASGVYFVRLETPEGRLVRRVVRLR